MEHRPQRRSGAAARAKAAYEQAIARLGEGRWQEAEAALRKAIRLRQRDPTPYLFLGEILEDQGRLVEAVAVYDQGCSRSSGDAALWYNLGCLLLAIGDRCPPSPRSAVEAFEQAVSIDPDDAVAWNNLGVAYRRGGFHGDAAAAFDEALALQPDHAAAQFNLGAALHALGRLDEAETAYREALRLATEDGMAHRHLALLLRRRYAAEDPQRTSALEEAAAEAREALRLDPTDAEARRILAKTLAELGDAQGALASYREAARQDMMGEAPPSDLGLVRSSIGYRALARLALWNGAWDRVRSRYSGDEELDDKQARVTATCQNGMGLEHAALGDHAAAIEAYRDAIRLAPGEAGYHENLALSLKATGDRPAALAAAAEAVRLAPERAASHFLLGLLQAEDAPAEAAASFRRALNRCRADPEVLAALALALEQLGDPEVARAEWEAALHLDLKVPVRQRCPDAR